MNTRITFSIVGDKKTGTFTHMEYINFPEKVEVIIKFDFYTTASLGRLNYDDGSLKIIPLVGGLIGCIIKKTIPKNLFDDLKKPIPPNKNIPNVILGYIHKTLPIINSEILKSRYFEGHTLARTVSIFDIRHLSVSNASDPADGAFINWPTGIGGFPNSDKLAKENDFLYIRDLIDAMAAYFEYNFDECIRKIITSLENYFDEYHLNYPTGLAGSIKKIIGLPGWRTLAMIDKYIDKEYYLINREYLKILKDNIAYVYKLRPNSP